MIYRAKLLPLSVSEPVNTDQTGTPFQLSDLEDPNAGQFRLYYHITQSNTATSNSNSPNTTSLYIEHSIDGAIWLNLMEPKVLNADGTEHEILETGVLLPYLRARLVAGGSAKPSHKGAVYLISNQAFRAWDSTDPNARPKVIG